VGLYQNVKLDLIEGGGGSSFNDRERNIVSS
jgi:hypothetical protein